MMISSMQFTGRDDRHTPVARCRHCMDRGGYCRIRHWITGATWAYEITTGCGYSLRHKRERCLAIAEEQIS